MTLNPAGKANSVVLNALSFQKLVTADGTYATQSAFSATPDKKKGAEVTFLDSPKRDQQVKILLQVERPPLRKYLMEGDFFIGAAIGSTLTKLALRFLLFLLL